MSAAGVARREYSPLVEALRAIPADASRADRMRAVCDLVWDAFSHDASPRGPYSWIGFYALSSGGREMTLEARRNKPACSPIGMHGACGQCATGRAPLVIPDVSSLGAGYIACDPRDRAEVVIPLFEADGACWGVLDGDSYDLSAFDESDASGLTALAEAAGLSAAGFAGQVTSR